jgi:hypothetical protein
MGTDLALKASNVYNIVSRVVARMLPPHGGLTSTTHRAEAWSVQQKQEDALDCKQRGNAPNKPPLVVCA